MEFLIISGRIIFSFFHAVLQEFKGIERLEVLNTNHITREQNMISGGQASLILIQSIAICSFYIYTFVHSSLQCKWLLSPMCGGRGEAEWGLVQLG